MESAIEKVQTDGSGDTPTLAIAEHKQGRKLATIIQQQVRHVEYWHVELPTHDVVLAQGLPAESYLDTGNRDSFGNGGGAVALHPDFARNM